MRLQNEDHDIENSLLNKQLFDIPLLQESGDGECLEEELLVFGVHEPQEKLGNK